ncbi:MAG: hypothetical protein HY548_04400, partial [Elusimicrobia bacterium]|nr:hypothetical protein [Elusimicrobiota bacterium]
MSAKYRAKAERKPSASSYKDNRSSLKTFVTALVTTAYLLSNVLGAYARELSSEPHILSNTIARQQAFRGVSSKHAVSLDLLPTALAARLKSIPAQWADMRDLHVPKEWSPRTPFVLCLQDAHANSEAQRNIAKVIEHSAADTILIGVEGARGEFNFHPYQSFPDRGINRRVADHLLKISLITGPEHVGMTSDSAPRFWGVEDEDLYLTNVAAFKEALRAQPRAKELVRQIHFAVREAQKKVFSPALRALTTRMDAFHGEEEGLSEYLEFLAGPAFRDGGRRYPQTEMFQEALALERGLDFNRVKTEREKARLARQSLELGRWPELSRYLRYVQLAERLEGDALFAEMESLEAAAVKRLAGTDAEKELVTMSRDLALVDRLLEFGLTPREREVFRARRAEIDALPRMIHSSFDGLLEPFVRFDDLAAARDRVLADNLLEELGRRKGGRAPLAVLVAGGFHAEGISKRLREKNVAYAVFSPRLDAVDGSGTEYLEAFHERRTPLEELLLGEKLNLNPELGTVERPMTADAPSHQVTQKTWSSFTLGLLGAEHQQEFDELVGRWKDGLAEKGFSAVQNVDTLALEGERREGRYHGVLRLVFTARKSAGEKEAAPVFVDVEIREEPEGRMSSA